jgi:hypothetical protein
MEGKRIYEVKMFEIYTESGSIHISGCSSCRGFGHPTVDEWIDENSKCSDCNGIGIRFSDIQNRVDVKNLPHCIGCNYPIYYDKSNIVLFPQMAGIFIYENKVHLCCEHCLSSKQEIKTRARNAFWSNQGNLKDLGIIKEYPRTKDF